MGSETRWPVRMKPRGARAIHAAKVVPDRFDRGIELLHSACEGWTLSRDHAEHLGWTRSADTPVTCKGCLREMGASDTEETGGGDGE